MQRNQVRGNRGSSFWYFSMADLDFGHKDDLHHPMALRSMALFLRDAMAQRLSYAKHMVVIGTPDSEGRCYVVSLRRKQQAGIMQV